MKRHVVHPFEMLRRHHLRDIEVEEVLAGTAPAGHPELDGVAELTAEMRRCADSTAAPGATPLLAAVLATGLGPTDKGDLPVTAASNADGPAPQVAGLPKWRTPSVMIGLFESTAARIAGAALAMTAGLGGLGVAGALPGPVQDGFADVAGAVGYDAPGGDDEGPSATVDEDRDEDERDGDAEFDDQAAEDRDEAEDAEAVARARWFAGAAAAEQARNEAAWSAAAARDDDDDDDQGTVGSLPGSRSDDDDEADEVDEPEVEGPELEADHDEDEGHDDEAGDEAEHEDEDESGDRGSDSSHDEED